jgi:glutathione synthase/RimK-type ligase-like ATP-grasp enzyme
MLEKLNRFLSKIFAFCYLLCKIKWVEVIKNYNSSSDNVIWIKTNPLLNFFSYLKCNDLLTDCALIDAIAQTKISYRIVTSSKIGQSINKKVFYNISETCNFYNLSNYSNSLFFVTNELEKQGNKLFPKSSEVNLWENKGYMQEKFVTSNISHPKTIILGRNYSSNDIENIEYPILVKEVHSAGSRGVKKVNTEVELKEKIAVAFGKGHSTVLLQHLVNMRKDLRVIVMDNKIILYYWRVNPTKEWKPTATSFGNTTEFGNFPEQWEHFFIESLKKLNIPTGAFDIAWENDDINTTPLVLEVSPSYQPNPEIPIQYKDIPFKNYKKKLFIKNAYHKEYVDIVFKIKLDLVKIWLRDA